ncbi:hypothetical protein ACE1MK_04210 [Tenacibaculum maritimum]|uniref:hypothetical protein n=1 Tax=Tenacibaculum maritimum TaxID=107401 RepID=UPI0035CF9DC1
MKKDIFLNGMVFESEPISIPFTTDAWRMMDKNILDHKEYLFGDLQQLSVPSQSIEGSLTDMLNLTLFDYDNPKNSLTSHIEINNTLRTFKGLFFNQADFFNSDTTEFYFTGLRLRLKSDQNFKQIVSKSKILPPPPPSDINNAVS